MAGPRKRKASAFGGLDISGKHEEEEDLRPPALVVQAHEATLVDDPVLAQRLVSKEPGGGLIRWHAEGLEEEMWVDRYDARLLLTTLPWPPVASSLPSTSNPIPTPTPRREPSPTGWSDYPSDAEEMFFFTPDEIEDIRRTKRRKMFESDRVNRLKAIQAAQDANGVDEVGEKVWGGSDEEPDPDQRKLMEMTAVHIASSPSAAQLEIRILANHGGDPKFAFLRKPGRWKNAWAGIKMRAATVPAAAASTPQPQPTPTAGLSGLGDYGDSSEDGDDGSAAVAPDNLATATGGSVAVAMPLDLAGVQAERRRRAKEWARKRRTGDQT